MRIAIGADNNGPVAAFGFTSRRTEALVFCGRDGFEDQADLFKDAIDALEGIGSQTAS